MYYFASDIHLGLGGGVSALEREKLLVRWLDEVSADAKGIALVGDVFDFWFEWRRVVPRGFSRLLGKLSELTDRGVKISFFTGNHDMWVYGYLQDECGVTVHERPEVFEAYGKKLFVAHGDNLYLRGTKPWRVKLVNSFLYSRCLRWAFATLVHPDVAMRLGLWWSGKSRKAQQVSHRFDGEGEYLIQYAREYCRCVNVDYFIFGHLHTPVDYDMGDGRRAVVLGEWLHRPSYAVFGPDGKIELKNYE
jgi:UDP-2,3-diacylglucosamine hydrolase